MGAEADRSGGDAARALSLFGASFAGALLAHQFWWRGFAPLDAHAAVALLAIGVLVRPSSRPLLAVLLATELVVVVRDLPTVGDHTLLALATSGATLAFLATAVLRARRLPDAPALWTALAPFLRFQAVVLYGAAALAKLNTGFLDATTSCAVALAPQIAWFDPDLLDGDWIAVPAIAGTIAVEAALAVLLAIPRTRRAGVVLGAAFHAVLALAGNVPFAALALALYVAFLPADARLPAWRAPAPPVALALALAAVTGWAGLAVLESSDPDGVRSASRDAARLLVAGWAIAVGVLAIRTRASAGAVGRVSALRPAFAAGATLLVLNAMAPYAGLKTEASFAMFSNLQTEPGHWNHVLIPEAVRVFGLQDELVRIASSSAPELERRRRARVLMVRQELERFLREHPAAQATYVQAGNPSRRWTASAATLRDGHAVLDRLVNFYDVRPRAAGRC